MDTDLALVPTGEVVRAAYQDGAFPIRRRISPVAFSCWTPVWCRDRPFGAKSRHVSCCSDRHD
jgi:hypothetical protein